MRRLAESSSVRSSHWVEAVIAGSMRQGHHVAREGADALAAHGVALVGHGRGADLTLGEGLVKLLLVRHEAQVRRHLRRALGDAAEDVEEEGVYLARVGLARDGQHAVKAHVGGDAALELVCLLPRRPQRGRGSSRPCPSHPCSRRTRGARARSPASRGRA